MTCQEATEVKLFQDRIICDIWRLIFDFFILEMNNVKRGIIADVTVVVGIVFLQWIQMLFDLKKLAFIYWHLCIWLIQTLCILYK